MRAVSKNNKIIGATIHFANGEDHRKEFDPITFGPGDTFTLTWTLDFTDLDGKVELIAAQTAEVKLNE